MQRWYEPAELPKYSRPPVSEAALAIEYQPAADLKLLGLANLQQLWRGDYPIQSDRMQAAPAANALVPDPNVPIDRLLRFWSETVDRNYLVQSAADRLILNWRKIRPGDVYPGYDALLARFEELWSSQADFFAQLGLPSPLPMLAEYTFVNSVALAHDRSAESVLSLFAEVQPLLPGQQTHERFEFIRVVASADGHPFEGRIELSGESTRLDGEPGLMFIVSAKLLMGNGSDVAFGLSSAHALASHAFDGALTAAQREEWGRA